MSIYIENITTFIKKDILKHLKNKVNYIEIDIQLVLQVFQNGMSLNQKKR